MLKAHKDAVSSLGGNGSSALGTVAAVVAAANATAKEAAKELATAVQSLTTEALNSNCSEATDGVMDNLSIMKVESYEIGGAFSVADWSFRLTCFCLEYSGNSQSEG